MGELTTEELENTVRTFIVVVHNLEQEQRFKSGGIALPKVNNYEEYLQLVEVINNCAVIPYDGLTLENIAETKVMYDIPERFRNDNR